MDMGAREELKELINRDRGILSEKDRRYLWDQEEYLSDKAKPRKSAHERQKAIEERLNNALLDIYMIYRELHSEDTNEQYRKPLHSAQLVIGHIFTGLRHCDQNDENDEYAKEEFRQYILNNASWAYSQDGIAVPEAAFRIRTKETDGLDVVEERFKNDGDVSDAEIGMLLDAGRISMEEFQEALPESSNE